MVELKNIKPSLTNIITTMGNLTNMEFAIFNTKSQLVSSTQVYLQRKGSNVHSASIDEVLEQGNVVVNKPGYMKSCIGCRFVNNCPSSIEILSCIKLNGTPIGVISLTSFTQEGHNMIENNIRNYSEILEDISNLITMYAFNENSKMDTYILHKALDLIVSDSNYSKILINEKGLLIHWDKGIQDLFSYCDLYTQTIHQMFPPEINNWIFSNKVSSKRYLNLENIKGILHTFPIKIEGEIAGYLLKIEKNLNKKDDNNQLKNYMDSIISGNTQIDRIKEKILRLADSPSSVLVTGETGTGKEMIARAIHYSSNRAGNPFVPINCANIPESLFESELFGYEEGAFTGAKKGGKAGLFEMANGGTIFLDEIGELTLYQQAKLLRVLQESSIQKVGSVTSIPLDIRIIAATNRDLESMIKEKTFRKDLYYRINVIPINLPPLSERQGDIPLLVEHFIKKYNKKLDNSINSISKEALDLLKLYPWPGNIRELENTIEYAINMEYEKDIQVDSLPNRIKDYRICTQGYKDLILEKEVELILNTLDKNGWDSKGKIKTAEELGISLRTLYRKLKEYNEMNKN